MHTVTSDETELNHAVRLNFKVTNNDAEYEAVLVGLVVVQTSGKKEVEMRVDSQVVVGQITGEYLAKGPK